MGPIAGERVQCLSAFDVPKIDPAHISENSQDFPVGRKTRENTTRPSVRADRLGWSLFPESPDFLDAVRIEQADRRVRITPDDHGTTVGCKNRIESMRPGRFVSELLDFLALGKIPQPTMPIRCAASEEFSVGRERNFPNT